MTINVAVQNPHARVISHPAHHERRVCCHNGCITQDRRGDERLAKVGSIVYYTLIHHPSPMTMDVQGVRESVEVVEHKFDYVSLFKTKDVGATIEVGRERVVAEVVEPCLVS